MIKVKFSELPGGILEVQHNAPRSDDAPPLVVLPMQVQQAMEQAQQGDTAAWGLLYAAAAAYLRGGVELPPPLAQVMAERLQAIGRALRSAREKDNRAALPAAVAPGAKRGRKPKAASALLQGAAQDVLQRAGEGAPVGQLRRAAEAVCRLLPLKPGGTDPIYSVSTLLLEAQKLRAAHKK